MTKQIHIYIYDIYTIIMQERPFKIHCLWFTLHLISVSLLYILGSKLTEAFTQQNPSSHKGWLLWIVKWLVWRFQAVTYLISYNMKGIISKVHQHHHVWNFSKIKTAWNYQTEKSAPLQFSIPVALQTVSSAIQFSCLDDAEKNNAGKNKQTEKNKHHKPGHFLVVWYFFQMAVSIHYILRSEKIMIEFLHAVKPYMPEIFVKLFSVTLYLMIIHVRPASRGKNNKNNPVTVGLSIRGSKTELLATSKSTWISTASDIWAMALTIQQTKMIYCTLPFLFITCTVIQEGKHS